MAMDKIVRETYERVLKDNFSVSDLGIYVYKHTSTHVEFMPDKEFDIAYDFRWTLSEELFERARDR